MSDQNSKLSLSDNGKGIQKSGAPKENSVRNYVSERNDKNLRTHYRPNGKYPVSNFRNFGSRTKSLTSPL